MSRQSNHDRYLETSNVNHNGDDEDDDDEDDDDYSPNNEDHASGEGLFWFDYSLLIVLSITVCSYRIRFDN